jgi:acetylornithine/succinyldiaminopimelate/putrescine aminotransferase
MKAQALADYAEYSNSMKVRTLKHAGLDIIEGRRDGALVWDITGREYVDCITSAGSFNIGRRNPEVVQALKEALDEYDVGVFLLASKPKADLAKKLSEITPGDLKCTMFGVGGGEAVDFAIKLARGYSMKHEIISLEKSYHGHTGLALSAIGRDAFRRPFEPLIPGFTRVPLNDLGAMERAVTEDTAAIIIEPILGEGGVRIADDDYLVGLRRLCDEKDVLLIFDEIQTGWGRTGRMFASEYSGVVPDIMTLAKSLGGSLYPLSATIYKEPLSDFLIANPFIHLSTFGGADLACIVGLKVIEILERERLWEHAATMGERFRAGFAELQARHGEILLEHRGRGLMMGLQYTDTSHGPRMSFQLAQRGVMALYSGNEPTVMRLMPSLVITPELVDRVLEALDKSMEAIEEEDAAGHSREGGTRRREPRRRAAARSVG